MKKKKWILNSILVVFILIFVGCGVYLANYFLKAKKTENEISELQQLKAESEEEAEDATEEIKTKEGKKILKRYKKLYKKNRDMVGWIQVKGTPIDYPVMQTPNDSEYYLHRNFKKEQDDNGLPFLDGTCDPEDEESNLFIYGHHMKSGLMFKHLMDFESKDFYNKHKIVYLDTLYDERQYEVVAAFYSQVYKDNQNVFKYYNYIGHLNKKNFNTYIKNIKALSLYDTGITPKYGEQLLTLVTCAYHVDDGRFVVVARRTKE